MFVLMGSSSGDPREERNSTAVGVSFDPNCFGMCKVRLSQLYECGSENWVSGHLGFLMCGASYGTLMFQAYTDAEVLSAEVPLYQSGADGRSRSWRVCARIARRFGGMAFLPSAV